MSYLELLLAVLITAFLVLGYTRVMTNSTKVMVNTGNDTNAMSWAAETLEAVRSKNYFDVVTGLWPESLLLSVTGSGFVKKLGSSNVNFRRQLVVSSIFSGVNGDLKALEVKVSWSEAAATDSLVLRTLMTKKD